MVVIKSEKLPIVAEEDIVRTRQIARQWAIDVCFTSVNQTKFVTAVSELARNTLVHGKGGYMLLEILESPMKGLRATFGDTGPGIADIAQSMKDGFTTAGSLGLGLGGAKRLSSEFEIVSKVGEGTRVTITKWL